MTKHWEQILLWASLASLVALVIALIGVPWVVARLPADYFVQEERAVWREHNGQPVFAMVLGLVKNLFGFIFVLLGLVMLVTPGQGLLTLLVGLLLMNFPGKYDVERWVVLRPGVLRALNWLRRRAKEEPFITPPTRSRQ